MGPLHTKTYEALSLLDHDLQRSARSRKADTPPTRQKCISPQLHVHASMDYCTGRTHTTQQQAQSNICIHNNINGAHATVAAPTRDLAQVALHTNLLHVPRPHSERHTITNTPFPKSIQLRFVSLLSVGLRIVSFVSILSCFFLSYHVFVSFYPITFLPLSSFRLV